LLIILVHQVFDVHPMVVVVDVMLSIVLDYHVVYDEQLIDMVQQVHDVSFIVMVQKMTMKMMPIKNLIKYSITKYVSK
jgi:hypothetical protein